MQQAIRARLRPRLRRLDLTLENTLEEYRRLAYASPGPAFVDAEGDLLPLDEWPKEHAPPALQLLSLKRLALDSLLRYFRYAGVYGQPEPPANAITVAEVTIVPVERLTNEQLDLYLALAEKGQALPPVTKTPPRRQ